MEEIHNIPQVASSSASCSSSPSSSQFQAEEGNHEQSNEENHQQLPTVSYRVDISVANPPFAAIRDDAWSCLVLLVTFWLVASMALIIGFYGSMTLQLGPYSSLLIQVNSLFVQSIKVEQIDKPKPGIMLYGFDKPPPLDVRVNWSKTYNGFVPTNFHKEWIFYLNKESQLDIFYRVESPKLSLSLVVAKGREDLVGWIEDPSYPSTTLSWNIIHGRGKISQKISESFSYYVALGNLNTEDVEVELKLTVNAFLYNTTSASSRCSPHNSLCRLNLSLSESNLAVLATPGPGQEVSDDEWFHVRLSYGPRWITYLIGSGMMTVLILFLLGFCNVFQRNGSEREGFQQVQVVSERAPLLANKNNDVSSLGSSYESFSSEEEDLTEWLRGKRLNEGETNSSLQRLCVICFDAPRDCFFLPCGHCAACFECGTRIAAEASTCPICRRKMKKVRKIFTV